MVQRYYNEKYPGMYRIILMDNNPERKPLWKAPLSDALYRWQFITRMIIMMHYHLLQNIMGRGNTVLIVPSSIVGMCCIVFDAKLAATVVQ